MTQRAPGRKSALIALTAVALLALGVMAPVASAQVSTSQIPGGDAVGSATGTVTDTITDTTSGGGGGGGSTTGTVTGTVDNVVDTTTGTTDTATGGVGSVVDSTGNTVKETADQTKKTVDNTTSETGTTVNGVVNGVGDASGGLTDPLLNVKDPRNRDRNGEGYVSKGERNLGGTRADNRKAAFRGETATDRSARKADGKNAALASAEKNRNPVTGISSVIEPPQRETFITQLAQAAGEAAEKLAFPLGLALMVGAFLMVQGRIDRKDAKLVLAPIDSEQDLLSFQ